MKLTFFVSPYDALHHPTFKSTEKIGMYICSCVIGFRIICCMYMYIYMLVQHKFSISGMGLISLQCLL